jgi:Mg-chelatase subunit ChlD
VGNVSQTELPPQEESEKIAQKIAQDDIPGVVINMEAAEFDQGLARKLAEDLEAKYYSLEDLQAEQLYHTVKGEIAS